MNAVTGLLSGVALILALYAVKIQRDGLVLQAEGLAVTQQQTQIQATEFANAFLVTTLDVYEKRLLDLTHKLKSEFSYPPSTVVAIAPVEEPGSYEEFRRQEMEQLIAQADEYRVRVYYLRAKLDQSLADAASRQNLFIGSAEFKDFRDFIKMRANGIRP